MKESVKNTEVLVTQSCPTLCDPGGCSPPGSSVRGILQARILESVAISSSRGLFPTRGSKPRLLHLPAQAGGFFYHEYHLGSPHWGG